MSKVARGFDRLAPVYDLLASVVYGNRLRKAQSVFLTRLPKQAKMLVLGGGSGWFLEQLIRQSDPLKVVYVEISAKMVAATKARIQKNLPDFDISKIEFLTMDVEKMGVKTDFDVICTHCFLDLFGPEKLRETMTKLDQRLKEGGFWYFSDFKVPEKSPTRFIGKALIKLMYWFFRITCKIDAQTLPDFESDFERMAYLEKEKASYFGGMIEAKLFSK